MAFGYIHRETATVLRNLKSKESSSGVNTKRKYLSFEEMEAIDNLIAAEMAALGLSLVPPVREPDESDESLAARGEWHALNVREFQFRRVHHNPTATLRMINKADSEMAKIAKRRHELRPDEFPDPDDEMDAADLDDADDVDDAEGAESAESAESVRPRLYESSNIYDDPPLPWPISKLSDQQLSEDALRAGMWLGMYANRTGGVPERERRKNYCEQHLEKLRAEMISRGWKPIQSYHGLFYVGDHGEHLGRVQPERTFVVGEVNELVPCRKTKACDCRCALAEVESLRQQQELKRRQHQEWLKQRSKPDPKPALGEQESEEPEDTRPSKHERSWANQYTSSEKQRALQPPPPEPPVVNRSVAYRLEDGLLVWEDGSAAELPLPKGTRICGIQTPPDYVLGSGKVTGYVLDSMWLVWKKI